MSEIAETLAHIDLTEMPTDITAGLPVGLYRARRGPWKASRAGHGSAAVSACSAAVSSQSWRHSRCVQAKRRWLTGMRNWGDCLMKWRRRVSEVRMACSGLGMGRGPDPLRALDRAPPKATPDSW